MDREKGLVAFWGDILQGRIFFIYLKELIENSTIYKAWTPFFDIDIDYC